MRCARRGAADLSEQVSPDAIQQMAGLLAENPAGLSAFTAAARDAGPPCSMHSRPPRNRPMFREGAIEALPIAIGVVAWGLVAGVAMAKSDMGVPIAILMSVIVYAGSAQIAADAPMWVVWATTLCVSLRFMAFSFSYRPYFAHLPRRRIALSFLMGDTNFVRRARSRRRAGAGDDARAPDRHLARCPHLRRAGRPGVLCVAAQPVRHHRLRDGHHAGVALDAGVVALERRIRSAAQAAP